MAIINFSGAQTAFETMIDAFAKTLTRTPVTKTISNVTGNESLTEGTPVSISGPFFRQEDDWSQDRAGLFQGADAILLLKNDVVLNKDDKITYDGQDYRVEKVVDRGYGETEIHQTFRLFLT